MDFFSVDTLQDAMEIDADSSSHPISFPVSKPSDIRRIFDAISYSKGASIIRMMNGFLGDKAFKGGLQSYLNKFQYDNAVQVIRLFCSSLLPSNGFVISILPLGRPLGSYDKFRSQVQYSAKGI